MRNGSTRPALPILAATGGLAALIALTIAGLPDSAGLLHAGETMEARAAAAAPKPAPSRLDIIKKLSGDWVEVGEDGKPTDKVISTYRVTAGGTAVEETLFKGSDHEMVTVYHTDGDDLVLTHYCVTGNHPRMKAEKQADPKKLVFRCAGGNMKSENDEHMHSATIVWKDDDHIHSEWQEVKDGKNVMTASFALARK